MKYNPNKRLWTQNTNNPYLCKHAVYTYLLQANSANTTHEQGQCAELVGLEEPEVPKTTMEMVLTCTLRSDPTACKAADLFKGLILTCEYIFM